MPFACLLYMYYLILAKYAKYATAWNQTRAEKWLINVVQRKLIMHMCKFFKTEVEAVSCLECVMKEVQKPCNINIDGVLNSIHHCYEIIQELVSLETDPLFMESMTHILKSLETQSKMFTTKCNLKNMQEKDGTSVEKVMQEDNYDIQKQNRISAIEKTIITKKELSFDDIAGLCDAKQALHEAIIMPLKFPHLFTGNRKPWKRILLYGPPGTGKSRLALALSSAITSTFYSISSADLLSSWVGESEKSIKELFQHACQNNAKSVIFIDEIDSICRKRNIQEEEHTRRFKTELLKQMEGVSCVENGDKVFLLCATNCPWELDVAFLRRFQKRIYIPLPDKKARIELLKIHTKDSCMNMSDEDWETLGQETELYSGSDIANLTLGALFQPIREMQIAKYWKHLSDGKFVPCNSDCSGAIQTELENLPADLVTPNQVQLDDFLKSMKTHSKTVSETDLIQFTQFDKSQSQTG